MSSQINSSFVSQGCQQNLNRRNVSTCKVLGSTSKNPGLSLYVPENSIKFQISVELGSPFSANKFQRSRRSSTRGERVGMKTAFPPNMCSVLYDAIESDENEEDLTEDENDDAQCIHIPSSSIFYHPPAKPRPFACTYSDTSFSCDALAEEGSFQIQPATLFHNSSACVSPAFEDVEPSISIPDNMNARRPEHDSPLSPRENLKDNPLGFIRPALVSSKVWRLPLACTKPLPDVPQEIESDFDYDYDSYSSESSYSDNDSNVEEVSEENLDFLHVSKNPVCPIDARPSLDRRVVAPFEDLRRRSFQASIVPKTSFCGLFFTK